MTVFQGHGEGHFNDSDIDCIVACLPFESNCSTVFPERDTDAQWLPDWAWYIMVVGIPSILLLAIVAVAAACWSVLPVILTL